MEHFEDFCRIPSLHGENGMFCKSGKRSLSDLKISMLNDVIGVCVHWKLARFSSFEEWRSWSGVLFCQDNFSKACDKQLQHDAWLGQFRMWKNLLFIAMRHPVRVEHVQALRRVAAAYQVQSVADNAARRKVEKFAEDLLALELTAGDADAVQKALEGYRPFPMHCLLLSHSNKTRRQPVQKPEPSVSGSLQLSSSHTIPLAATFFLPTWRSLELCLVGSKFSWLVWKRQSMGLACLQPWRGQLQTECTCMPICIWQDLSGNRGQMLSQCLSLKAPGRILRQTQRMAMPFKALSSLATFTSCATRKVPCILADFAQVAD